MRWGLAFALWISYFSEAAIVRVIPSTVVATSGAVFVRAGAAEIRARGANPYYFGESWRDPSGVIWGDMVREVTGRAYFSSQLDANDYCQRGGAELPSREDFVRLQKYMSGPPGYRRPYMPQILPNLVQRGTPYSYSYWSSIPENLPGYVSPKLTYVFHGGRGALGFHTQEYKGYYSVRCVSHPPIK